MFILLAFLVPIKARAEMRASPFVDQHEARLRLLAARDAQGNLIGAIEIQLAAGFKTYWKNAGDSGVPPHFDFSQSTGLRDTVVRFPLPQSFDDGAGGKAFGYTQDVMFALEGKAAPGATLRLKLDFAVCGTLCIPLAAELALAVESGPRADAASVARLESLRAALPRALGTEGVSITRTGAHEFTLRLPYGGDAKALQVFPDAPAFFEVKEIGAAGPGMVALRLLAQPAPGKAQLGPLSLTYGTREQSFERVMDVDGVAP
jgi:DsbC/DsbD-like thiol-disulfide interchange protein